jgi:hypothetical protein
MDWITLVILALATWRVAAMFVKEDGPGLIFRKVRALTGIGHDESGKVYMVPDTFMAGLLSCVWCASVWVGAGWIVLWYFLPEITLLLGSIFALSALAIAFDLLFPNP